MPGKRLEAALQGLLGHGCGQFVEAVWGPWNDFELHLNAAILEPARVDDVFLVEQVLIADAQSINEGYFR